jgi:hypothetical protein
VLRLDLKNSKESVDLTHHDVYLEISYQGKGDFNHWSVKTEATPAEQDKEIHWKYSESKAEMQLSLLPVENDNNNDLQIDVMLQDSRLQLSTRLGKGAVSLDALKSVELGQSIDIDVVLVDEVGSIQLGFVVVEKFGISKEELNMYMKSGSATQSDSLEDSNADAQFDTQRYSVSSSRPSVSILSSTSSHDGDGSRPTSPSMLPNISVSRKNSRSRPHHRVSHHDQQKAILGTSLVCIVLYISVLIVNTC